ncbi:MAG TPA: nitroreductase family protein [Candidatus Izemoplasmatales bacterium]|nr:nitroreductase family protein [Bacillota bacterium]HRY78147.1 nitroreductase family protein [Candidatus Izemoplasmatales bacterium]
MEFLQALQSRRSVYALGSQALVADEVVGKKIQAVIEATPSAFNSQSQRVVLLWGDHHKQLWNLVLEALKKIVSEKQYPKTAAKIAAFAAGRGTILFFDDQAVTKGLMADYPLYKENFAIWYQQQAGMLQSNIWVALAEFGYGASLQHYNELIADSVRQAFGLPAEWELLAQMPFGNVLQAPEAKEKQPIEERFRIID